MSSVQERSGRVAAWCLAGAMFWLTGCARTEPPRFKLNFEGKERSEVEPARIQGLVDALVASFGEPDEPFVFAETGLDLNKIRIASGAVSSDQQGQQRGLYRQHCAHCHGVSGDGAGPTALFLKPYPRDYRRGIFKYKATERSSRPSTADLQRILREGIPGTAMPSFALLASDEIDALVEYVKYLSMRGEVEQFLYALIVDEEADLPLARDAVLEQVTAVADIWKASEEQIIAVPEKPPVDVEAGRKLFVGTVAQCTKCHGPTGLGDGGEASFDDWNKDKTDSNMALYHLPKQDLPPRNLRLGIYRGGRRPVDLYRRIYAGINGAPMPAAPQGEKGLSSDDIWHIVDYIRSLPYEEHSVSHQEHAGILRDLN